MIRNPFRLPRAGRASPTGARPVFKLIPVGFGWLTPLLLGPACALALDIGEIQVHSALNQLFDARIPLPTLTPEELGKISVKLAPSPMFKEFDLDRASTLSNLVFSLEYNAEGQVYVKVISTKPIREPSLGLLVEFGWPRGKTFREFTVLLDPVQRLAQRPDDRSKTVLNASTATAPAEPIPAAPAQLVPAVAAAPAQPVPAVAAAAAPESQQDAPPTENSDPVAASTTAVVETVAAPEPIAPVAEAAPAPVRVYRPGDTYGPVATGEGLWGIALKVRPDPAITREQMMQALFQANPHAFSKAGIEGLRIGTVLRIPSFQEIANFTGSSAARHLAEVQPLPSLTAPPPLPSSETTESPVAKAAAPEAFPLEPLPLLEPVAITDAPAVPAPAALTDAPAAPVPESAATAVSAAAPPSNAPAELDPIVLEPVSAMSLLFLAISEMMAADIQPSATTIRVDETAAPAPKDPVLPLAVAIADPVIAPVNPADADTEAPAPATTTTEFSPQPMDTASLLAAVDLHPPRLDLDTPARAYLASDVSAPMVAVFTQPLPIPVQAAADNDSLSADETDTVKPATVAEPPLVLAAGSAATSAKVNETPARTYQGNDQYGPVAPNARLWDIATQVRPDPAISREHMMKALLKANPQAFSKSGNMDSLKIGATLRIPTLQEIVEYTGSKAASQLLEQQQATPPISPALPPESEPAPAASKPEPEPEAAKPESTSEPAPTASEPEPEAAKPESTPEPVSPAPEPEAAKPEATSEPAPTASEPEPEATKLESTPEPAPVVPEPEAAKPESTPEPASPAPEPEATKPESTPEPASAAPASEMVATPPAPPAQEPAANAPVTETPPTPPAESVTTPPAPAVEVAPKPVTETRSAPVTSTETTPASPSPAPITETPPAPVIETPSAPESVITPAPAVESVPTSPASSAPAETVPATPTPEALPVPAAESVVTPPAPAELEPADPPPVPAR